MPKDQGVAEMPSATVSGVALASANVQSADTIGTVAVPGDLRGMIGGASQVGGLAVVVAAGFWTSGDGGGGAFYWDEEAVESDNGGTVIQPTGHGGAGRWKRVINDHVDVRWFGAKGGDGTTPDDTEFIRAAVDVLNADARPGGTLSPFHPRDGS
jgi:hypothetical protein